MAISTDPGVWVAVALTLMAYSFFLYKDTPLFKFAEVTLSGTAAAHVLVTTWKLISDGALTPLAKGDILYVVPIVFGCLLYTRYSKKYIFTSRWSLALVVGTGLGLATRVIMPTDILSQIVAAARLPFFGVPALTVLNSVISLLATVTALIYFFLTIKPRGPVRHLSNIGRMMVMIVLGAAFGSAVWTRLAWFIDRVQFIVRAFGL